MDQNDLNVAVRPVKDANGDDDVGTGMADDDDLALSGLRRQELEQELEFHHR